jgi:hypothetical protein
MVPTSDTLRSRNRPACPSLICKLTHSMRRTILTQVPPSRLQCYPWNQCTKRRARVVRSSRSNVRCARSTTLCMNPAVVAPTAGTRAQCQNGQRERSLCMCYIDTPTLPRIKSIVQKANEVNFFKGSKIKRRESKNLKPRQLSALVVNFIRVCCSCLCTSEVVLTCHSD